ncbi:hypothetical protein LCGC14_1842570 [marine sediment metagenome]|uniref:Uncharacterized protein n=1 Tax=marine sediment metagenome TaxID=412755 RepID=A0A0F9JC26_9ZZZZ
MGTKNKGVTIKLDESFFDNLFEPKRRKLEKELGMKITQLKFSRMIKGLKLNVNLKNTLKNGKIKTFRKK